MKCICGAQFRKELDFFRHFSSNIHKDWMNLEKTYHDCTICYNLSKTCQFVACPKCRNKICNACYTNLWNTQPLVKCPYCRYSQF